ncbi:MAG: tetratricopeptide repeat protein [Bacteroidota bacterium]
MREAIVLMIAGVAIAILTLVKPNFFWNRRKALFVRGILGDAGTTILYLLIAMGMLGFGVYTYMKLNDGKELDEISTIYLDGKVEEAQKRLLVYTNDHSSDCLAWTILGHTYLDQEKFDEAIKSYQKGIEADKNAFEPYSGLGLVYAKMGEYEKAKDAYEKANTISPNQGSVIGNLASLYDDLQDIKKSIEYGKKSIQLDSTDATLFANLSIYYNKAGLMNERDVMFNKAKELGYEDMQSVTDAYALYNDTLNVAE